MSSYTLDRVEELMAGVWDTHRILTGRSEEEIATEGMPRSKPDPSHGNAKLAEVADVQRAYALCGLTRSEQVILLLHYGFREELLWAAQYAECSRATAFRHRDNAIARITRFLNGDDVQV